MKIKEESIRIMSEDIDIKSEVLYTKEEDIENAEENLIDHCDSESFSSTKRMKLEPEDQSSSLSDYTFSKTTQIPQINIKQEPVPDEEDACPVYSYTLDELINLGAFNDHDFPCPLQDTENQAPELRPVPPSMLIEDHQESDTLFELAFNLNDILQNPGTEYNGTQISDVNSTVYDTSTGAQSIPYLPEYYLLEVSDAAATPSETRADTSTNTNNVNDENNGQVIEDTRLSTLLASEDDSRKFL